MMTLKQIKAALDEGRKVFERDGYECVKGEAGYFLMFKENEHCTFLMDENGNGSGDINLTHFNQESDFVFSGRKVAENPRLK